MGIIGHFAIELYLKGIEPQSILDYKKYFFYSPLFMILIWFTWFSSKQMSYFKQIYDEYMYKYALSKSYLSYRDEAKKLANNNEILLLLLGSVINNISTSPVQSVKSDCHTPFSEILNAAKEAGKINLQNKKSE